MSSADIVLHVESFETEEIMRVRYSFSTKIIDCIQSGGVFFVIGPKEVASVKYSRNIPGAIVVTELEELENELIEIINRPEQLSRKSVETRKFAEEKHSIVRLHKKLEAELSELIN